MGTTYKSRVYTDRPDYAERYKALLLKDCSSTRKQFALTQAGQTATS